MLSSAYPVLAQDQPVVSIEYYGEIGCSHCDTFEEKLLPAMEEKTGVKASLATFDILSAAGYERCKTELEKRGYDFTIFPVLVIGNNVYQGGSAVEKNLKEELAYFADHGAYRPRLPAAATEESAATAAIGAEEGVKPNQVAPFRLAFIPILLAGLIDGVNPCAFTTLLFFISYLALRGKTRKLVLLYGLLFAAGVFIAYFVIGFGLTGILRAGLNLSFFRLILRITVSLATAAFAALSVMDFIRIRRGGHPEDMALKLPGSVRIRIHATIRAGMGKAGAAGGAELGEGKSQAASIALAGGVFLTGLVVSVLELACTGQVYLPSLSYMVQTGRSGDGLFTGLGGLFLYNVAFILPLLAVLGLTTAGVSQQKVAAFFKSRLGFTKLLLAGIFVILAVLIWVF